MSMRPLQFRSHFIALSSGLFWVLLLCGASADQITEISSSENVKGSLVTVTNLNGWTLEAVGSGQKRELVSALDGESFDLEALHRGARVGYAPYEWLQLQVGLGGAKPQVGGVHGEDGLEYKGCARVSLLSYPLESSVVYGNTHSVSLQTELSYAHVDAQLSDRDFVWSEFVFAPYASYAVDYRGAGNWNGYDPRSADLRAGLLFSSVDARWGGEDLTESRDFGWLAGGDVQLASDVVFGVTAYVLHSQEVTMELTLGYRF